jgi:Meckel syndrome type 1 protein
MEILFVLVLGVLAVGAYVFFKSGKNDVDTQSQTLKPLNTPVAAPVTTGTISLAPVDTPAKITKAEEAPKEALVSVISQVAEAKQETVVAEPAPVVEPAPAPVVESAPVVEETKPAAKKTTAAKTTAPKPKKKK